MRYWKDIKHSFSNYSETKLRKLKILCEEFVQKVDEGYLTLPEKSTEEVEILKIKCELHRKQANLLELLTELGGSFFDKHKEQNDPSRDKGIQINLKLAFCIEGECKQFEEILEKRGANPALNESDFEEIDK